MRDMKNANKVTAAEVADLLNAALTAAMAKAGVHPMGVHVTGYMNITEGRETIHVTGGTNAINVRAKKFATAWIAKHYPELHAVAKHASLGGKRAWWSYYSNGKADSICRGCYWKRDVSAAELEAAITGRKYTKVVAA